MNVNALHAHYCKLVELAKADEMMSQSHSVEEAAAQHNRDKREGL
jgi:hypothetical protein